MTIGNDAGKGAALVQQGIRQVREGRTQEAYAVFQEAVVYDPGNEFGWIWLSITSPNKTEKRAALERALQINPNSSHARQALRALDAETVQPVAPPPPPDFAQTDRFPVINVATPPVSQPIKRGLSGRLGERASGPGSDDNLTQNLREATPAKNRSETRQNLPSRALVGTRSAGQNFARAVRVGLLGLLVLIVIGLAAFYVYTNVVNKPNNVAVVIPNATPTNASANTAGLTSSAANSSPIAPDTALLAPTNEVATALAPSVTPETMLLPTPTLPVATPTPDAVQISAEVSKLLNDGQASAASNDFKTAFQTYKQILTLDPTNIQANLKLGLAYLTAPETQLDTPNRYDSAITALRTVTDLAPTWPGGFAQLGAAYAAKGDLANAIKAYRTSLDLDPNGPERWLALATLYERNNQAAEATYARSRATSSSASTVASSTVATTVAATTIVPTSVPPTALPATTTTVPPVTLAPQPKPTATPVPPTFTPVRAVAPTATPTKKK